MITSFTGEYAFLSNASYSLIHLNNLDYKSAEAAFQAQKTADAKVRECFAAMSARDAEQASHSMQIRKDLDWEHYKVAVMYAIVKLKFVQNKELGTKLLATGEEFIVYDNKKHDTFWGQSSGEGKNVLGKILMLIRSEIREGNLYVPLSDS